MIFGGWVLYGFIYQIGLVHIVPYATDLGLTAVVASTLLTVIGIIGIFSRIGQGIAGDRFGNRQTVLVSYILMGLGYAGLTVSQTTGMIYAFAVIYGSLYGAGILLIPLVAEYFGYKNLGMISGALIFSNSIGGALGPLLAGGIFDATGSYQWAFALCAAGGVAAGVIIWLVKPVSGLRKE